MISNSVPAKLRSKLAHKNTGIRASNFILHNFERTQHVLDLVLMGHEIYVFKSDINIFIYAYPIKFIVYVFHTLKKEKIFENKDVCHNNFEVKLSSLIMERWRELVI